MTLKCECLRRVEEEASTVAPKDVREGLETPITDGEWYLAVHQGAPNKSPGWDEITLEYYKMYWGFNKDVTLKFYNQMFQETKITAAKKNRFISVPSKEKTTNGTGELQTYRSPHLQLRASGAYFGESYATHSVDSDALWSILWGVKQNHVRRDSGYP